MQKFTLDKPDNLVDWWEESYKKFADRKLFGTKNKNGVYGWVTYKEVGTRINNLRAGLAQLGIDRGDVVGIIANNRVEWPICAFATWGRLGRFVPMYEAELVQIWKYIITDSGINILFFPNRKFMKKSRISRKTFPH
jgi:long-chain acyl-CoA synthetase